MEIADAIRQTGCRVSTDLKELWRRLVFNIMVSNTDDHLRNHGFLWDSEGWRLSPAFDLNPTPTDMRPRVLSLAVDEEDPTGDVDLAFSVAHYFDLKANEARDIVGQVSAAVGAWRDVAKSAGLSAAQRPRVSSAFHVSWR